MNEWQHEHRQKRGGGCLAFSLDDEAAEARLAAEAADDLTPERAYERRWAEAVLEEVLRRLGGKFTAAGLADRFEALKVFLVAGQEPASYADRAARLGLGESARRWGERGQPRVGWPPRHRRDGGTSARRRKRA